MQLIFVRHAQSCNNLIQENPVSRAEFENRRSHDAEVSELGFRQAAELGRGIERALLKRLGPRVRQSVSTNRVQRVHVAVSPMKRTLLTAAPMIVTLQDMHARSKIHLSQVEIVPFIFEIGGCYSEKDGVFVGHPGMTSAEAKQLLPMAQTSDEMENGWWKYSTRESEEQYEERVVKTTEWIKKMACTGSCDVLIVVSHQDFACTCMRRLAQVQGINWLYNTSLSSMTLLPIKSGEVDPEATQATSDGTIRDLHHCQIIIDWINAIDHLSIENVA